MRTFVIRLQYDEIIHMLKKYKHISFDLDGTLVHTIPEYRHRLIPEVVEKLGGTIREKHFVDKFWFEADRDATVLRDFGVDPADFWKLFREIDTPDERSRHTNAYHDSERALRKLKESGKIISIITGAPHWIAEMEIGKLNGAPHDFYISIDSSEYEVKPDPGSLLHVLEKLGVAPEETLYIGNSNEDAFFAKNAGTDFLYMERNEHPFDLKDISIGAVQSLDELFPEL